VADPDANPRGFARSRAYTELSHPEHGHIRIAFPQSIMPADTKGAVRISRESPAGRESRHDTQTVQAKEQAAGTPSGDRYRIEMGESALTTSPSLARH
jgi:hypothetical protein